MNTQIISIISQKGGTGKTVFSLALGEYFTKIKNKKVLVLDLDSQCNLTQTATAGYDFSCTIADFLTGKLPASECVTSSKYFDLIAGTDILPDFKLDIFRDQIKKIAKYYDVIIIDNSPTLSDITLASLIDANKVIIPLIADSFSLQGLNRLVQNVESLQKSGLAKKMQVSAFFNRYTNTTLCNEMIGIIKEFCTDHKIKLLDQTVRQSIVISEAISLCEPILSYKPKNKAVEDLIKVIENI